jgi:hypothetical protein
MTTAQRFYLPFNQIFDNVGLIGPGWKVKTYATGTTTPLATYSDIALAIPNSNPANPAVTSGNQVADSSGRLGDMFVSSTTLYKVILTDQNNVVIKTADPVDPKTFSLADFDPQPASFWGVTSGTSAAYILVADPTMHAYKSNQVFLIEFHIACVASPTLAIDGKTVLNLKKYTSQGSKVSLLAGDIQAQRYWATNDGVDIIIINPRTQLLYLGAPPVITVAGGILTLPNSASEYQVDTEGGAATDDLDTINGTVAGQIVVFAIANNARITTFKHGTGNLKMQSSIDFIPTDVNSRIVFIGDGTNLCEISRSSAGALGPQLLQTSVFSGATEVIFTNPSIFSSQFSRIVFEFELAVATNAVHMSARFSTDGGASYIAANYTGVNIVAAIGDSSTTPVVRDGPSNEIDLIPSVNTISNISTNTLRINAELKNSSNTDRYKSLQMSEGSYLQTAGVFISSYGAGRYQGDTSAVNAIRFFPSAGTIAGTIKVRGYP